MTRLIECDREHVTEATLSSLLRQRQELRDEVEVLEAQAARDRARIADLEGKLTECMAAIDRAHDAAVEECAAALEAQSDGRRALDIGLVRSSAFTEAAEIVRALKGATT